jgi:hypothetical protein
MSPVEPTPVKATLPEPPPGWELAGGGILRASVVGTAVFTLAAVAGAIDPDTFGPVTTGVSVAMFLAGCAVFVWAYAVAVGRSRTDEIGIGGLFFLMGGTAPVLVRRRLMGLFAIEVVVALAAAGIRPFTVVAYATLAPVYGLSLAGLWGARYGRFGPRVAPSRAARVAAKSKPATPTAKPATKAAGTAPVRTPPGGVDQNGPPSTRRRGSSERPRPRTPQEERNRHGRTGDAADHR